MLTSARPRTLVLVLSDVVIDVAMLGPRGTELGPRQVVPLTTETAMLWQAINVLGEFDRITLVGADPGGIGAQVARQSQRPLRHITFGQLQWSGVIAGHGVELALVLAPRLSSTLYHQGVEVPDLQVGWQLARKGKRYREYLAPRVLERKGVEAWGKRVSRAIDDLVAVFSPTTLYIATDLPMPDALPSLVVVVPVRESLEDALVVWEAPVTRRAPRAELPLA